MTTQIEKGAAPGVVGRTYNNWNDHTKYWPCKYHTMGCECVIDASVFCPKVACVWASHSRVPPKSTKCILTGNQTVFELAKGADE